MKLKNNLYIIFITVIIIALYVINFDSKIIPHVIIGNEIQQKIQEPLIAPTNKIISNQTIDQIISKYNFTIRDEKEVQNHRITVYKNDVGAFLVKTISGNNQFATLSFPGSENTEYYFVNGTLTINEQAKLFVCGTPSADLIGTTTTTIPTNTLQSNSSVHIIDLLVFYDAQTFTDNNGNTSQIDNVIIGRVEAANLALQNSNINMRWNFIASYQVPYYAPTGDMANDLKHIESMNVSSRDRLTDPVALFAFDKMVLHGADQSVFYVSGSRNYAGLAYTIDISGNPYHYSVVLWSSNFLVMAHEMGHNFGCNHDRQTEASSWIKAYDGDNRYFYGHRFSINGSDTGDIMSYAANRLPYYGNPDIIVNGFPMGIAVGQLRAANCAKVINDMAATMESYRTLVSPKTPPILNSIIIIGN